MVIFWDKVFQYKAYQTKTHTELHILLFVLWKVPDYIAIFWFEIQIDWQLEMYEGWNFNSGNFLFTTDTK